uniref:Uncharacterized protein n=1 Tax=Oryza sativa subsp. japonica TaxID=39947 RepID=Q6KAC0_ORYSJ|nr:hypothetical protein [Oryza sativa Japonica Group]
MTSTPLPLLSSSGWNLWTWVPPSPYRDGHLATTNLALRVAQIESRRGRRGPGGSDQGAARPTSSRRLRSRGAANELSGPTPLFLRRTISPSSPSDGASMQTELDGSNDSSAGTKMQSEGAED